MLATKTTSSVDASKIIIDLVPYDPAWPSTFNRLEERIRCALGDSVLALEHVGSTAVPGLSAKPIIDVVLVVKNSANEPAYLPALERAGFALAIREPAWFEHRLLRSQSIDANIHVFTRGCIEIDRMLRFRDRLRADDADRRIYEQKKRELAGMRWKDIDEYANAKTSVVEVILTRARAAG